MTERLWEIPSSWEWTVIKELGDVVSGATPSTKVRDYWDGDVIWFAPSDLTGYKQKFIARGAKTLTEEGLANSSARIMPAGSVMFSSRAPVGYVAINSVPAATNQGFKSVVPYTGIFNEYLYHYLKASKQMAEQRATGTTFKELSGAAFGVLPAPLPPTNEQRRIVEKIEAMFDEIDKGVESLQTARATLGLYRQSLLKSAFEGRLTADWRAQNADKLETPETLLARIQSERDARYKDALDAWQDALSQWRADGEEGKRPAKPRRDAEPDAPMSEQRALMDGIPPEWQWLQIGTFGFVTKLAGFEYTKHVIYRDDGDLPVIKAENAGKSGFKVTDYSKVRSEEVAMLTRSFLNGGELLMVFVGAGTGQVATVPTDQRYFLGPNIGMIRLETPDILPKFVEHYLRSPIGTSMKLASVKAVAQPSLSMGTIRQIPVAIPSPTEQAEIVRRLDARLEAADALEAEIDAALTRADALRQSILKKAFSGQLVPQDPKDEPASALLDRIKAERAKAPNAKKRRSAHA